MNLDVDSMLVTNRTDARFRMILNLKQHTILQLNLWCSPCGPCASMMERKGNLDKVGISRKSTMINVTDANAI